MTTGDRPASAPDLRSVRRELTGARDEQIARVVAIVDALPRRGDADAIIDPLRPRLAELRPPRPVRLIRLLFTPLNPLIVPPAAWRRGSDRVPRNALAALGTLVRQQLGPDADRIEADVPDATEELWSRAAGILAGAATPADWQARTGLSAEDFLAIAAQVAQILDLSALRQRLAAETRRTGEPDADRLAAVVGATLGAPPQVAAAATGLLLATFPRPDKVLEAADNAATVDSIATMERAIGIALDAIEAELAAPPDGVSPQDTLRNAVCLLQALDAQPVKSPERVARLAELRRTIDLACRGTFTETMTMRLLAPMALLSTIATDTEIASLESTARDLRRLEVTGRQVNNSDFYAGMLQSTLQTMSASPGLTLADRVRLTEMLSDSNAAIALLTGE